MQRLGSRRLNALKVSTVLAVALPLTAGCGAGSEPGTTLPQSAQVANPSADTVSATVGDLSAHVESLARASAARAYVAPDTRLPGRLGELDYDAYRTIEFRREEALWRGESRFEVQFSHPGFLFSKPVRVHVVEGETAEFVDFDPGLFRYGEASAAVVDVDALGAEAGLGFAGFRVLFPLNDPNRWDEVLTFQGASYFRLVGPGQVYGLSSRGLAVNVASGAPEEFPDFREFWLVRPSAEDTTLVLHALLDGPSVTGAYRFEVTPGAHLDVGVDARVFARRDVGKLGVAPMSSMFLYGPEGAGALDDFRPRVHDSEGLMTLTGSGEWIWRPLSNGRGLRVSSLRDRNPQGFGLVQRTRRFEDYLDMEAQYHRRPSEWVQVEGGDWGSGGVELLEIPSPSEFNDNIAVYWVPDEPLLAGQERRYRYRLTTFDNLLDRQTLAYVARTRSGSGTLPGDAGDPSTERLFVVDFERADPVTRGGELPRARLETSSGEITDLRTQALPSGLGWRASFRLAPDGEQPADMRLYLEQAGERWSETWTYVWYPQANLPGR